MKVKKLIESAQLPVRGSADAAGHDLFSVSEVMIEAKSRALVPTGIAVALDKGTYGRIAPRSGLAVKHGLDVLAGVVDSDYRGEVVVVLYNTSDEPYTVKAGDKCAQLVIEKHYSPVIEEVSEFETTDRGEGGFGSTGY